MCLLCLVGNRIRCSGETLAKPLAGASVCDWHALIREEESGEDVSESAEETLEGTRECSLTSSCDHRSPPEA